MKISNKLIKKILNLLMKNNFRNLLKRLKKEENQQKIIKLKIRINKKAIKIELMMIENKIRDNKL